MEAGDVSLDTSGIAQVTEVEDIPEWSVGNLLLDLLGEVERVYLIIIC
jgi:hypothetical protein